MVVFLVIYTCLNHDPDSGGCTLCTRIVFFCASVVTEHNSESAHEPRKNITAPSRSCHRLLGRWETQRRRPLLITARIINLKTDEVLYFTISPLLSFRMNFWGLSDISMDRQNATWRILSILCCSSHGNRHHVWHYVNFLVTQIKSSKMFAFSGYCTNLWTRKLRSNFELPSGIFNVACSLLWGPESPHFFFF